MTNQQTPTQPRQEQAPPGAALHPGTDDVELMTGVEQFSLYPPGGPDTQSDHAPAETAEPAAPPDDSGTTSPPPPSTSPEPPPAAPGVAPPQQRGTTDPPAASPGNNGDRQFRHKSQADAERSYAHLLSRTTRAEQRAAELQQQLEQIEATKIAAARAEQERAQREAFVTQEYEEASRRAEELDPTADDYHQQVARVWAAAHAKTQTFQPEVQEETQLSSFLVNPSSSQQTRTPADGGEPRSGSDSSPADPDLPEPPAAPEEALGPTREEITNIINARLSAEKVDFTADDPAFMAICGQTPDTDPTTGQALSIEDQVRHAIHQTREHYRAKQQRFLQQQSQPLSRSGATQKTGPSAGESTSGAPSFGDVIDEAVQARVL